MFRRNEQAHLDKAMDRYAEGDDSAFRVLHAGLSQRLRRFLRRMSGSAEQTEDLLQETLLRVHRARGTFRPGSSVVPWSYAIARNVFVDAHRRALARPPEVLANTDEHKTFAEPEAGPESSGEERLVATEAAQIVAAALGNMTARRREAFILMRYEGRSVRDSAQILGVTEGAVKLRTFHAYEQIRQALRQGAETEQIDAQRSPRQATRQAG